MREQCFLGISFAIYREDQSGTFFLGQFRFGGYAIDLQRVDQEIAKRRVEIEVLLSKGPAELSALRRRIVAARGQLQGHLEKAFQDVAQAQADGLAAA